jgi:hypothetical protein
MTIGENAGSVATLWRFPVKSMGGEQLSEAEMTKGTWGAALLNRYRRGAAMSVVEPFASKTTAEQARAGQQLPLG